VNAREGYYEALLDASPSAIVTVDMDGMITSWNPGAERLFGHTREAVLGQNLDRLISTAELLREADDISRQAAGGESTHTVSRRLHKDGSLVDVDIVAAPIVIDGEGVGYYAIYSDISELQQQRRYYEALLEASPSAIATFDVDHTITSWNPAAERLFGYSRDEAIGRDIDPLVAARPDLLEEARLRSEMEVAGRVPARLVTQRTRKDGSLVDVDIVAAPITVSGELAGHFAIYSDISELQRQKRYFEALFESSPTAIVTVNLDSTIASWNPAAERLFGYTPEEAVGHNIDELLAARPDLLEEARRRSATAASGREPGRMVSQRIRKDGSVVDVTGDGAPIFVAGKQVGYFAMYSDISVLQQRTRELAEKSRQLEIAGKHKSDFLANMSHELRTPLNAIIGFSEVLHEQMFGELNERQLAYVNDVLEAGRHLLSLINDVLDLAKIEAGKMELEISQVSLTELLRNAVSMQAERASRAGVELALATQSDEITIAADERRLRQVVFNLLSNAVKFTPPEGRVDISARVENGQVEVAVADTGHGIAAEDLETIFEEFEQAADGKQAEGTGLGLPLSRKLAELHGGRLWAESEPGKGSTFRFTLPIRQEVS
jgi:PAS domain S-box-containing protein